MPDAHAVGSLDQDYSRLGVRFYLTSLYNEKRSKGWMEEVPDLNTGEVKRVWHKGEGKEVFEDTEFIEIRIPGNVSEVRCREVRPSDKEKWPREYDAFKKGHEAPVRGTPTGKLPFLTLSQVEEFKSVGVRTAEDIINISDSDAQKFMGIHRLKQQTKDYLAAMEGHSPIEEARAEIAALRAQVTELSKGKQK